MVVKDYMTMKRIYDQMCEFEKSTKEQKERSIQLLLNASFFLWKISDSNRSPQHCQRCALAR